MTGRGRGRNGGSPAGLVVGLIQLQVEPPIVGGIQDAEPYWPGRHLDVRIDRAVDERRVHEALARDGRIRHAWPQRRLPGRGAGVLVRYEPDLDAPHRLPVDAHRGGRVEPWAVEPLAEGVHSHRIIRVRDHHVDVRVPEIAGYGLGDLPVSARAPFPSSTWGPGRRPSSGPRRSCPG